ncbi:MULTISPECIES: alpha/beta fold hydrolase [unclassified Variovorax]|uniref:alpha/beta fold hydrolase n=1 Tax=unclassified Variovorax TaxID=663243 RepID=UPI00210D826B|nr:MULTISPECIES: alpha/beta fold hydrolase [unclassified Variovorax]
MISRSATAKAPPPTPRAASKKAAPMPPAAAEPTPAARLREEVERMIQRGFKGLEYFGSPAPQVGVTPRRLLHRRGTLGLYHYEPLNDELYRVPLLLVMATTNKANFFDLTPGQSMVEYLMRHGYDVYVMDWNAPTRAESGLRIEDYVLDFIPDSIRRVQQHCGEPDVSLIGYCMGGVLATIYAALHPGGPLKNLVTFTTPIDWTQTTLAASIAGSQDRDVDRLIEAVDLVPPESIISAINLQRPASRAVAQVRLWDNMWNDKYVKAYRMMQRCEAETLPMAGTYSRQILKELIRKNGLVNDTLRIGGRPVRLENIEVPLLHIMAQYDHMVPQACGRPLVERAGSRDKSELILPGGHASLVAGPNAVKRMWPALDQWLAPRSV